MTSNMKTTCSHLLTLFTLATATGEIQTLRANLKQARQDYQSLETQLREVRSTENATKVGILLEALAVQFAI